MCCIAAGSEKLLGPGGVMEITQAPRDKFAPQAIAFIYREVVRFSHSKRTTQTTDGYLPRFDLLRREAESQIKMGGAFLPRADKPLVAAGMQGDLGTASAAGRMRRLVGLVGNALRQDVLAAADVGRRATGASDDGDFEPWVGHCKKREI